MTRTAATTLPVPRDLHALDAAWMTAALAPAFPGAVVAQVEVGPVADGTNRRARVRLRYAAGQGPPSVFVKGPGRPRNRLALAALGAHLLEADLAAAGFAPPLAHARLLAGARDPRRLAAAVVLGDVTEDGGVPNDGLRPLSAEELASGLSGLAALHAAFWERPAPLGSIGPWHLGRALAPVSLFSLRRAASLLARQNGPALPRGAGPAALERQFRGSAALATRGAKTLLHGDPHPANTFTLPGGRLGFLDWQLCRTGVFVHDVGYFLVGSATPETRRAEERALLEHYLGELRRHGVDLPGFGPTFALYRATPAFGLATWLHTLAFNSFQPVATCHATIARFAAAYVELEADAALQDALA